MALISLGCMNSVLLDIEQTLERFQIYVTFLSIKYLMLGTLIVYAD